MADSVVIKIDGDDSGYKKTLENIGKTTKAGMADVKAGIDLATAAMQKLASVAQKGISYNANIESLQTSFEVMTGSAEKAAEVVERLRTMGAETPFETQDLVTTTQLLMQYGFTADDAIEKMSMLGDIAQGNAQAMNSVALGYAQMSSAGKVNLVDIKQMINAGFNPLQEISERTGESMASLYDRISKGTMSVDEITQSMVHATSEGGKFYQSMEKQSQTLNGQLSTLKDNVDTLMGSLTEGLSDDLRNELLPLANNMIGELQTAFETGGVGGLTDAATSMIPNLLEMMSGEFEDGISAIGKWLPKGASSLMKHVPQALRGASSVAPQITTALFEVATVVITDLISMMPEWGPALLEGFVNTAKAALKGAVNMLDGVFMSTFEAFGIETKKHINGLLDLSDVETTQKMSAKIDGEIDTSDLDEEEAALIGRIDTLYKNVRAVLTDGKPDTPEVLDPLKEEVEEVVGDLYEGVDEWEKEEIAKLDPESPDYATALANIQAKADEARLAIETYHTKMNTFIDEMAGKSAATVEANIGHIQTTTDELKRVIAEYGISLREASPEGFAFKAVTAGGATDEQTVGLAIDYVVAEYKVNEASIQQSKDEALAEAAKVAEENPEKALQLEQEAQIKFETDSQKNKETFQQNAQAIMSGLGKTLTEEQRNALGKYSEWKSLQHGFVEMFDQIFEDNITGEFSAADVPDEFTLGVLDLINLGKDPNTEFQAFTDLLTGQISVWDFAALKTGLAARLQQQIDSASGGTGTDVMANAWQALLSTDVIDANTLLDGMNYDTVVMNAVDEAADTLTTEAENAETAELQVPVDIPLENLEGSVDEVADALTTEAENVEPVELPVPIDIPREKLEDSVDEATETLATEAENAEPAELPIPIDIPRKKLEGSGEEIVESVETGAEGSFEAGVDKGNDYASGYIAGVNAQKNAAYNAGYALGKETARGTAAANQSSSPSKVAKGLGNDFGDGYSIGLRESMARAVAVARQLTGHIATSADITQTLRVANMPNLSQEIAVANEQVKTPVFLDSHKIAEIQGFNNSVQLARRDIRSSRGVGRK